jgi:tungstate transport system substrate-binding protein
MRRYIHVAFLIITASLLLSLPGSAIQKDIIFATTTSTQDSGLLDLLVPLFEKKTGYMVKTIAVGSGQAMSLGERGEADLLLVHSPDAEIQFMKKGFGVNRRLVMHNDFVIIGPAKDPAKVHGLKSADRALRNIHSTKSLFISRGDRSGTHVMEMKLWKKAGLDPEKEKWYQQTGLGMGQSMAVANEKLGYILCDRATFLSLKKKIDLVILVEGDASLLNIYHVIEVNARKFPKVNAQGARAFADFWVQPATQKLIGDFGIDSYGARLFFPDAGKKE